MKTLHRFLSLIVHSIMLILFSLCLYGQSNEADLANRCDRYAQEVLASQHYVAFGVCMMNETGILWEGYYGYADLDKKIPLVKENIFPLMSLSKTVTTVALMQLVEKGLVALDDDINRYSPIPVRHPHFPDVPITFRMLLNHTAGFEDVTPTGLKVPKDVERPRSSAGDSPMALDDYITQILTPGGKYYSEDYFGPHAPGTRYSYSNIAFSLIGYLVQHIAKEDFSRYCNNNIFIPLGLNDTRWRYRELDTSRVFPGYSLLQSDTGIAYRKVAPFGEPGYPAGMLRTTPRDFSVFLRSIFFDGVHSAQRPLQQTTIDTMLKRQGMTEIPSRSFKIIDKGLGWLIIDIDGTEWYTMNGFSGSYFAAAFMNPQKRTVLLYFCTGISMQNMMNVTAMTKTFVDILKHFR
jgi:CubicO group peptidase (beta-lactamase class C family)